MRRRRCCGHTCGCGVLGAAARWTPEQALAAYELLMELQQALWKLRGPQIQQAWREQLLPQEAPPGLDPGERFWGAEIALTRDRMPHAAPAAAAGPPLPRRHPSGWAARLRVSPILNAATAVS